LHAVVLKIGILTQNLVVVGKLGLLIGFTGFAFWKFPSGWEGMQIESKPATFSVFALASTLVWISLSFSGFNAAVYVTGEVDRPKTNVPRAMLLGTLVVAVLYLALNFVFIYGPQPDKVKAVPDVAAAAAQAIGGSQLATLIRVIVSVALLSSISSMVIAGPRVYAKMADDGLFPKVFSSATRGLYAVPSAAIWLQAALASVVVYFSSLKSLLDYLGFTLSVSAAIAVACIFWTKRENDTGFHRVWFSMIAVVYVGATIILATLSAINRPQQLIGFAITVLSGMFLYAVIRFIGWNAMKNG
jgi:amino acid transporter